MNMPSSQLSSNTQIASLNRIILVDLSSLELAKTSLVLSFKLINMSFLTAPDMITSSLEGLTSPMGVVFAGRQSALVNMNGLVGHIPVTWKPLIAVFIVPL